MTMKLSLIPWNLKKFISDSEFDADFFNMKPKTYEEIFPENIKEKKNSQGNKIIGYLSSFISSNNYKRIESTDERNLIEHRKFYDNLYMVYQNLYHNLEKLRDNNIEFGKNNENGAMAFLYFKEFDFVENEYDFILKCYNILKRISKFSTLSLRLFDELLDKIESFLSILQSIIDGLKRFEEFLDTFTLLEDVNYNSNPKQRRKPIDDEYSSGKELHSKFIKSMLKVISKFSQSNMNINNEIFNFLINIIEKSYNHDLQMFELD